MPSPRTQRRREAVLWLHGRMGTDMFTTHEMWAAGEALLDQRWPKGTKPAFKSLRNPDALGLVLRGHPAFGKVDGGNHGGRMEVAGAGRRVRSTLWELRVS